MNNETRFIASFLIFLFILSACAHFLYVKGYAMRMAQSVQERVHEGHSKGEKHGDMNEGHGDHHDH